MCSCCWLHAFSCLQVIVTEIHLPFTDYETRIHVQAWFCFCSLCLANSVYSLSTCRLGSLPKISAKWITSNRILLHLNLWQNLASQWEIIEMDVYGAWALTSFKDINDFKYGYTVICMWISMQWAKCWDKDQSKIVMEQFVKFNFRLNQIWNSKWLLAYS